MDFARKQLEKYGWSEGKGLGKHENGISVPLRPKIKCSVTGVGHDPASEFTEHWWTKLYDKAAENVEVEEKNGKTKKIKIKDDQFKITSNTWQIKSQKSDGQTDNEDGYSEYFVKKAILTSGGSKTERVRESSSESEGESEKKDVFQMTDEELFAACEGRTAHKGARHGLKATGKLARIERQEAILLIQPKYKGYSHAEKIKKNNEVFESTATDNISSDTDTVSKKKRKRKHCSHTANVEVSENDVEKVVSVEPSKANTHNLIEIDDADDNDKARKQKSSKKANKKNKVANIEKICEDTVGMVLKNEAENCNDSNDKVFSKKKDTKNKLTTDCRDVNLQSSKDNAVDFVNEYDCEIDPRNNNIIMKKKHKKHKIQMKNSKDPIKSKNSASENVCDNAKLNKSKKSKRKYQDCENEGKSCELEENTDTISFIEGLKKKKKRSKNRLL